MSDPNLDSMAANFGLIRMRKGWGLFSHQELDTDFRKRIEKFFVSPSRSGRCIGEGKWAYLWRRIKEWWAEK